ncbi:hypothetical protein [Streptomyces sp. IB2014 016-6]|uniref:hypothetical protein n=1 Tax=Streptomyces sp. IB2014 016-6 TaxID=2517818 RepID=UPI001F4F9554|nr:hypothetical protein [Streptomyces sp. IB2014 016-6]
MTAMGAGPALRLARTAVFAAVCVVVSGLGHALSSGGPLPPRVLALAFLPVCAAGWWLSGKERGGAVVVGASAAGQLLLHAVFSGLHPLPPGGHAGHGGHGAAERGGGTSVGDGREVSHEAFGELLGPNGLAGLLDSSGFTSGMLGAHLLAGLVCGWWLWRGDRAFVQLVGALALFACEFAYGLTYARLRFAHEVLSGGAPAHVRVLPPPVPYRPIRPPAQLPAPHAVSRRGPPLLPS